MATIGSLVIKLQAETAALRTDLKKARREIRTFATRSQRSLSTVDRGFAALGKSAKAFIGVFAVGAGLRGLDRMFQSVSNLADTADKLGVTAEQLQQLRFAAEQTGVASNTLDMAIQRFTRRLGEAAQGGGELKGTLDQYGIAVADARGRTRDTVDVLADLSDVIQGANSDAERLRIGFKAFDSEGAALVNTLRRGSAGLQELTDRAVVTSNALVARGAEINNQWRELTNTLSVGLQSAILGTITLFEDMWIAAMPGGVFRIGTDIDSLETQLGGLRDRAREVREEMMSLGEPGPQMSVGRQGVLNRLQRELTEIDLQSFEVQQRLRRLQQDAAGAGGIAPTDTTARDRIAGVTDELRFQAEQLSRTAEVQQVYNEARRAGVEVDSAAGMEIRNLVERLQEAGREQADLAAATQDGADRWQAYLDALKEASRQTEDGMSAIRSSSERALGGLARDLLAGENAMESLANAARQTVDAIIQEFLRIAVIRPIIGSIFGVATAAAGTVATSPAGGAPTGGLFQHGGSFIADGPGGTDAIAATIGLSKGERVTVETPEQQRQGRGGGDTFIIDARGADRGGLARLESLIESLHGSIERRAVSAIVEERARNPALFRAGF